MSTSTSEFVLIDELTAEFIGRLWDKVAWYRYEQIRSKIDVTYTKILLPTMISYLDGMNNRGRLLDVGCGVGFLTDAISRAGYDVTAIDCSRRSIDIASRSFADSGAKFL